jgi:hypothetical protein
MMWGRRKLASYSRSKTVVNQKKDVLQQAFSVTLRQLEDEGRQVEDNIK